ncbi:MAG: superoxide dismutase family protein [Lachnospiraceae bacterium]|nr:superoxide dismutase family protein [Lachnospiraceae bacterium]
MPYPTPADTFVDLLSHYPPQAQAWVRSASPNLQLSGIINFYQTQYGGVLVEAEVFNLPNVNTPQSTQFYGMHIHEYGDCSHQFQNTGNHFNPSGQEHPDHLGDLPPLFGNQGYAYSVFYDKRFTLEQIIGKSIIIHSQRDDFTSQPSGDSGTKIGCGVIQAYR